MGISPGFVPNASLLSITTSKSWASRMFKNWLGGDGSGCRTLAIQNFQYRRRDLASTVTKGEMNLTTVLVIETAERHRKRVRRDPGVRYGQLSEAAAAPMMARYKTTPNEVIPMTTYAVVVSISQKYRDSAKQRRNNATCSNNGNNSIRYSKRHLTRASSFRCLFWFRWAADPGTSAAT